MTEGGGRRVCYNSTQGTVDRSATVLRVPAANWLSSILVHTVLEIVLREYLGFSVEVAMQGNSSAFRTDAGLEKAQYDIDLELWRTDPGTQAVEMLGPIGYLGRAGLFVNRRLYDLDPMSGFYKFWKEPSRFSPLSVTVFGDPNLPVQLGFWVPPTCKDAPQQCAIVLHSDVGYNEGYFEQLVAYHNLSAVVGYAGRQSRELIRQLETTAVNTLFHWWEPDPLPDQLGAQRVSFPNSHCVRSESQEAARVAQCDFRKKSLEKAVRTALRREAPEALYAVSRMQISEEDIRELLGSSREGGGSMDNFEAACAFVKAREATLVETMAPPCISSPLEDPQEGDLVFDRNSISCVPFEPLREAPSSSSCLTTVPDAPDRRHTRVRLARGEDLSQDLVTAVVEVLLRDVMRYSVWLVNVSELPASRLTSQMEAGLFDLAIRTFGADESSLRNVTTGGAILNSGPVGYSSRSSLFVLPHTVAKAGFADFWQFYAQSQGQGQSGPTDFYKFSDVDLRALLGADFPVCAPVDFSWCGAVGSKGFYVPTPCENNTGDCLVVFAATPELGAGYFEQVARNLQLPLVWAYLGPERLANFVRSAAAASTRDLLFHALEPDLLPGSLGAERVTFPECPQEQGQACTAGYSPDPRVGTVAYDHVPVDPVKLLRAELAQAEPEVAFILGRLSLSQQDMQQLMELTQMRHTRAGEGEAETQAAAAACDWVRANLALLEKTVVPACVARPKASTDLSVGDEVFIPNEGYCEPVVCPPDEVVVILQGSPACKVCGSGLLPDPNQTSCVSCSSGSSPLLQASGKLECICDPGLVAVSNSTDCQICSAGMFADGQRGAAACHNCSAGTYSSAGSTACQLCPAGTASESPGMAECVQCDLDQYQERAGSTVCDNCRPNMLTPARGTANESLCSCKEGAFRTRPYYLCKACPLGMICPAGSDLSLYFEWKASGSNPAVMPAFPLLKAGYMSPADDPMSVYQCSGADRCPGGVPGTCGPDLRTDLVSCGRCLDGFYWKDDHCGPCPSTPAALFPLTPSLLAPALVAGLYMVSRDEAELWGNWRNCMASLGLLVLNTFQTIVTILRANLVYDDFTSSWTTLLTFTEDPMVIFRPQCAGVATFGDELLMRVLVPVLLLIAVLLTHLASHAAARLCGHDHLKMDRDRSANIFFNLIFAFFPALSVEALTAFMCTRNPNGKSTLLADRSVHCYDQDWNEMIIVAGIAISYVVGFGTLFIIIALIAPAHFGKKGFQRRWKFLFAKFNPDTWWWSLCFCGKNVLGIIGFTFIQSGYLQLYWVMLVTNFYCFGLFTYMPWRHKHSVNMDFCCCFVITCLASLVALVHATADAIDLIEASLHSFIALLMLQPMVVGSYFLAVEVRTQMDVSHKVDLQEEYRLRFSAFREIGSISDEQAIRVIEMMDDWGRWHINKAVWAVASEVNASLTGGRVTDGRISDAFTQRVSRLSSGLLGFQTARCLSPIRALSPTRSSQLGSEKETVWTDTEWDELDFEEPVRVKVCDWGKHGTLPM